MSFAKVLIGNTSSGIIEAASFGKYVVNVGDRQKGRMQSDNIINSKFTKNEIIKAVGTALKHDTFNGINKYYIRISADLILKHIKNIKDFNDVL